MAYDYVVFVALRVWCLYDVKKFFEIRYSKILHKSPDTYGMWVIYYFLKLKKYNAI